MAAAARTGVRLLFIVARLLRAILARWKEEGLFLSGLTAASQKPQKPLILKGILINYPDLTGNLEK